MSTAPCAVHTNRKLCIDPGLSRVYFSIEPEFAVVRYVCKRKDITNAKSQSQETACLDGVACFKQTMPYLASIILDMKLRRKSRVCVHDIIIGNTIVKDSAIEGFAKVHLLWLVLVLTVSERPIRRHFLLFSL